MKRIRLLHVDGDSFVHRLRPHAKIVAVTLFGSAMVFRPQWPVIAIGWAVAAIAFTAARLPRSVLAPPPPLFFYALGFGGLFTLASGGDPVVAGIELGGLIDFLQLMAVSLLVIALGAVLAWTTSVAHMGLGVGRLLRPLRHVGLPSDELATVAVLAARSLPLVREELGVAVDARAVRPRQAGKKPGAVDGFRDVIDLGATVLVGAHRRSRELAKALVARGSVHAPTPGDMRWRARDWLTVSVAAAASVAIVVWF